MDDEDPVEECSPGKTSHRMLFTGSPPMGVVCTNLYPATISSPITGSYGHPIAGDLSSAHTSPGIGQILKRSLSHGQGMCGEMSRKGFPLFLMKMFPPSRILFIEN